MSWRVTFSESYKDIAEQRLFAPNETRVLTADGRIELRSADGDLIRMNRGAEVEFQYTEEGWQPVIDGEFFTVLKGGQGKPKVRTSCWMARLGSDLPQILCRPAEAANSDEVLAVYGAVIVYEYDEKGAVFDICTVLEGQKAVITFNDSSPKRQRYAATVGPMSDEEQETILRDYLDHRRWR